MDSPSPKILLTNTSTTSLTLHDRFTRLTNKQAELTDIRRAMPQPQAASLKNQRLVQQMASRPSVLAALKSKPCLRQHLRLGNIKERLGMRSVRGVLYGMPKYSGRGREALVGSPLSKRLPQRVLTQPQPQHGVYVNGAGVVQNKGVRGKGRGSKLKNLESRAQTSEVQGVFVGNRWPGGRCRADSRPVPTREELDKQLDEYMAEVDVEILL
ncbi:chromatin target of PRMT1b [Electrophorus electricus]|uniref:chromatin target of PRMT1b n=1 Tax=Electrophorus electricus TaxID=8005 RepID=UPI0015D0672C|nr:chromatin target of PRMT1b [Electrophorus electricus]